METACFSGCRNRPANPHGAKTQDLYNNMVIIVVRASNLIYTASYIQGGISFVSKIKCWLLTIDYKQPHYSTYTNKMLSQITYSFTVHLLREDITYTQTNLQFDTHCQFMLMVSIKLVIQLFVERLIFHFHLVFIPANFKMPSASYFKMKPAYILKCECRHV
jgi:hypothetical protein